MRYLLLTSILLWSLQTSAECQCLWQGSFVDVEANTDLVASGTVIAAAGNSIDLYIDRELRSDQNYDEVRVWLKSGDYCRPDADNFPIGSQWVMALDKITEIVPGGFNPNTPNVSYGRVDDFQLSSCGGYWLSREGDWVTGNLIDAPRWVREPKMTPVLLDLLASFIDGEVDRQALLDATREDPALRELMLDTKAFLRGDD